MAGAEFRAMAELRPSFDMVASLDGLHFSFLLLSLQIVFECNSFGPTRQLDIWLLIGTVKTCFLSEINCG